MDLAHDHGLSHPPLRPHKRVDARFEWPAVPASDRCGLDRDGVVWAPDHLDRLQTPRTLGLVRLMVLPAVLDVAPSRRIAARQRSRPPGRVHRSVACWSAPVRARVLRTKGGTGTNDLVKFQPTANLLELRKVEVQLLRMHLPRKLMSVLPLALHQSVHLQPSSRATPPERLVCRASSSWRVLWKSQER